MKHEVREGEKERAWNKCRNEEERNQEGDQAARNDSRDASKKGTCREG
jgi:hypothetical protein